jgi:hypothetical protein
VDGFGNRVQPSAIKLTRATGADFSRQVHEGTISELPFGDYKLRILVPGFELWEQTIHIAQPTIWVTAGMRLGAIEGPKPYCRLQGHVSGLGGAGAAWVRLLPIYGNEILDARIAESGNFDFGTAECGEYIIAIIRSRSLVQTRTVTLTRNAEPISISVSEAK